MSEERLYSAHTYSGGEENFLTLEQARKQVAIWEEKGYHAFVTKPSDPNWEDVEDQPQFTSAAELAKSFPDREVAIQYAKELLMAVGCDIDHENRYFVVYDALEE